MTRRRTITFAAAGVAAALGIAACSSGGGGPKPNAPGYGAAINSVVQPSNHKGGTLIFDNSSVPDSTDPGNTYYAFEWNMVRLYTRALVTYKSVPGPDGN